MANTQPYLESDDVTPGNAEDIIEWARYLGQVYGTAGALSALKFYSRIGWITEPALHDVVSYLRGLSLDELHNQKYDDPETFSGTLSSLSGGAFSTHAKSLKYIADIAGDDLEDDLLPVARSTDERQINPD